MSESPEDTMPMTSYLDLLNERDELLAELSDMVQWVEAFARQTGSYSKVMKSERMLKALAVINKSTQ